MIGRVSSNALDAAAAEAGQRLASFDKIRKAVAFAVVLLAMGVAAIVAMQNPSGETRRELRADFGLVMVIGIACGIAGAVAVTWILRFAWYGPVIRAIAARHGVPEDALRRRFSGW